MKCLRRCMVLTMFVLHAVATQSAFATPSKILFCSNGAVPPGGTLKSANLDGTSVTTIRSAVDGSAISNTAGQSIRGCTYDQVADKIFFSEGANLISATITNASSTTLQTPGGTFSGIAIDGANSKMYWSDSDNDAIRSNSSVTASGMVQTLVSGADFDETRDLEIDAVNSFLYVVSFSSTSSTWSITKVKLDGTSSSAVVTGLTSPVGVAVDAAHNRIFYTDAGTAKVWKADLDGSNQVDLSGAIGAISNPQDIDYEADTEKIYWLDNGTSIKRSNPDGSSAETVVSGANRSIYLSFYKPDLVTLSPTLTSPATGTAYVTNLPINFTLRHYPLVSRC